MRYPERQLARADRYRLSKEMIWDCCEHGYKLGFRSFVLQGGEDPKRSDNDMEEIIAEIRRRYPECAITLSIGEKPAKAYERYFMKGADRYLLRHETFNRGHYYCLHPYEMSNERRIKCLPGTQTNRFPDRDRHHGGNPSSKSGISDRGYTFY